jgi:hypothetical protein
MKRALFAVAVASLGLTGCQEAYQDPGQTEGAQSAVSSSTDELIGKARVDDFNPLDSHLAALATEVLLCKGSFTQKDFFIDQQRVLRRCEFLLDDRGNKVDRDGDGKYDVTRCRFECKDPKITDNIDNLLAIQDYDLLPDRKFGNANAVPYFASLWSKFLKRVGGKQCPQWNQLGVLNPPTPENVRNAANGTGPDKTSYDWQIDVPIDCQRTQNPINCAVTRALDCASFAGEQFLVSADRLKGVVQTDPKWWKDATDYGDPDPSGIDTPYNPTFGYEHEMAEWGLPPGDLWGAVQRQGEWCHVYNPTMTFVSLGSLQPVDCNGIGWMCATTCMECPLIGCPLPN